MTPIGVLLSLYNRRTTLHGKVGSQSLEYRIGKFLYLAN
jgi:hypothetical protein